MINSVNLTGRLVKDPELSYTPSGVAKAKFTLAVNRSFSNQSGEREADFIMCVAWRKQAENLSNFMKKGNLVGVTGRIQTGSYEGQDGKRIFTTDVVAENVVFLESRGEGGNAPQPNNNVQQQQQNVPQQQSQPQYQKQPQQQYGAQQQPQQQNYSRVNDDPFANSKGPIEVSEDDLPFNHRSLR